MPHRGYAEEDRPGLEWKGRCTLILGAGRWKMRNGRMAIVRKELKLPYIEVATGTPKLFHCWQGICACCRSPMTWNVNGTFAAAGRHPFDIVGKAK